MASLLLDNFSGGLNLRDSVNKLAVYPVTETDQSDNWTLEERGGLELRNGCANAAALPGTTLKNADIFYSAALDLWLCARESGAVLRVFSRPGDLSGSWTDRGTINSSATARAAFVDFPLSAAGGPKVVICTDVNSGATKGTWTLDGAFTLTNVSATVSGNTIALWQNKVWVAGYPTSDANGNPTTLRWCDAGDPVTWTATNTQQIRDKDAAPVTALNVVSGALIAFKKRSAYRVTDSSTGSYTTIDSQVGCVNARAHAALQGRIYVWAPNGIYECDGVGKLVNVGDKIRPVYFSSNTVTTSIVAGVYQDRVIFHGTLDVDGSQTQRLIEYHPLQGWLMRHFLPAAGQNEISSFTLKESVLYGAVVDGDDLFSMFTEAAGTDDGTTFFAASLYRTPWLMPNSGMLSRLQRVRVQGRINGSTPTLQLEVYKDWDITLSDLYEIGTSLRTTSGNVEQLAVDVQALGHGVAFALQFRPGTAAGATSIRAMQLIDHSLAWPNPGYPKNASVPKTSGPVPTPTN